jgi:hypothetical protein
MAVSRAFAYNTGGLISGLTQTGNLAISGTSFSGLTSSLTWYNGPDETLGYVIAYESPGQSKPGGGTANVQFWRSATQSEASFLSISNYISSRYSTPQNFTNPSTAKTWLNTNGYWTSFVPGIELLLDTYSGAAAAYSLRKLSSTYTGSAIRVRRSSDNTEQDIGFDGSGNLNQSTLTTFVGAGSGYVVTWYDQSGNNINMTWWQAVTQAKIVNSGTIETLNSNPCLNTTGINVFYRPNNPVAGYTNVDYQTLYAVGKIETAGNNFFVNYEDSYERIYINSSGNFEFYKNDFGTPFPGSPLSTNRTFTLAGPSTNPFVLYVNMRSLNLYASYNGNSESSLGAWGSAMRANRYLNGFGHYQGKLSEMIMWNSDQSSNKTGIDTNMNTFYSVY